MRNEEVDLIEVLVKLWGRRWVILCCSLVCLVVGAAVAFFLPKVYTVECTLGLEVEDNTTRVSVEGMSAFQTMNMDEGRYSRLITPGMYPDILFSVPFQKELIYTPLFSDKEGKFISFYEYFLRHNNLKEEAEEKSGDVLENPVIKLTALEKSCLDYLRERIEVKVNSKERNLKLKVTLPEPEIAAGLAQQIQEMLQVYITRFRVAKAQAALDFIEERYSEVKNELAKRQEALIGFKEKHDNHRSLQYEVEEKILLNEYELFFGLYSDIVKQREKGKIQVKENMPVLTVIEPVVLPTVPSKPQKMLIMAVSLILGLFLSCGWVLCQPLFAEFSSYRKKAPTVSIGRVKKIS